MADENNLLLAADHERIDTVTSISMFSDTANNKILAKRDRHHRIDPIVTCFPRISNLQPDMKTIVFATVVSLMRNRSSV